jgi:hypothetical protein
MGTRNRPPGDSDPVDRTPASGSIPRRCLDVVGARTQSRSQAQIFELTESLADTREELDAVREINRELLADRNRPAH